VIRLDGASESGQPPLRPDTSVSAGDFVGLVRQAAVDIEITVSGDKMLRFGEQLDIKLMGSGDTGDAGNARIPSRQIAGYLAKYVTKSVADFGVGVRRFSHRFYR
jgi:hypothetical protein